MFDMIVFMPCTYAIKILKCVSTDQYGKVREMGSIAIYFSNGATNPQVLCPTYSCNKDMLIVWKISVEI